MTDGRRFQFLIDKIENNTLHLSQILQNGSENNLKNLINIEQIPAILPMNSINNTLPVSNSPYDSSGAAKYIVVVVLVYGFAIIFFIGSQVRSTKKFSDDNENLNAEKVMRSMETDIFTKEVLEKLLDKNHRDMAWKIYLSDDSKKSPNNVCKDQDNKIEELNAKILSDSISSQIENTNKIEIPNSTNFSIKKNSESISKIEDIKETSIINKTNFNRSIKNSQKTSSVRSCHNWTKKDKKSNLNSAAPLLILQTDLEGLTKLKKTIFKNKAEKINNKDSNKISNNLSNQLNSDDVSDFSFDRCEISELQITSV